MSSRTSDSGDERVLTFDCKSCDRDPSIGRNAECMEEVIRELEDRASVYKVLLKGEYVQEYRDESLDLLENFVSVLKSSRYLALKNLSPTDCSDCEAERKERVEEIWGTLYREPTEALAALKQWREELREESTRGSEQCKTCRREFLEESLESALETLADAALLERLGQKDSRKDYQEVFKPATRPAFLRSKLSLQPPENADLGDAYEIGRTKVRIYRSPERLEHLYFVVPPEYRLPPREVRALQDVKKELVKQQGSLRPDLAREEVEERSKNMLMEASLEKNLDLGDEEIGDLSKSLAKFTAGLGMIETLLEDPKIQDIYVDAPVGENPLYIYHQDFEECLTNVYLTSEDAQILTSRFRAISGRPFSEADPTLDLNLEGVRIAAIQEPLSPEGLALAIRRHKSEPWTLPLFVKKDFMTPDAAALLSLLVDSQASILVTGSRGAGKTSLLGALMLELLPKYRILCLEDTAELPIEEMRDVGYKAQRLQVKPSTSGSDVEMSAEDALRAALRLGESVLVVGEVRGPETRSLYEAMRVGAAGNSVMGTIHGSSAKDVYERVVYDLGIPPSSFKATDAIAVASPIRSKGSVDRIRRLTQITEVGKSWEEDPLRENGFRDLMSYDPEDDTMKSSPVFKSDESRLLRSIAEKWSMDTSEVRKNFEVRSKIIGTLVETSVSEDRSSLLEAGKVVESNLAFHRFLEEELRGDDVSYDRVFTRWKDWLREVI